MRSPGAVIGRRMRVALGAIADSCAISAVNEVKGACLRSDVELRTRRRTCPKLIDVNQSSGLTRQSEEGNVVLM